MNTPLRRTLPPHGSARCLRHANEGCILDRLAEGLSFAVERRQAASPYSPVGILYYSPEPLESKSAQSCLTPL
ncbi:hypothetical protein [Phytohalomonas tamaricis]|uniref:hypothetical protein n=1 Tax=Phytohalomonas tamaricis TaxID=2081032 RepID=UPI001319C1AE|nr:hypothetical protein [Phytohalomonas tamaricis]